MSFNVTLESVARASNVAMFRLELTYHDTDIPDWVGQRSLDVAVDPNGTVAAQRQQVRDAVIADAQLYRRQNAVYLSLQALQGTTIEVTA